MMRGVDRTEETVMKEGDTIGVSGPARSGVKVRAINRSKHQTYAHTVRLPIFLCYSPRSASHPERKPAPRENTRKRRSGDNRKGTNRSQFTMVLIKRRCIHPKSPA